MPSADREAARVIDSGELAVPDPVEHAPGRAISVRVLPPRLPQQIVGQVADAVADHAAHQDAGDDADQAADHRPGRQPDHVGRGFLGQRLTHRPARFDILPGTQNRSRYPRGHV